MVALGEMCESSCQCLTVGATCSGGICSCPEGKVMNFNNDTCVEKTLTLNSETGMFSFYAAESCCRESPNATPIVGVIAVDGDSTAIRTGIVFSLSSSTLFSIDNNGVVTQNAMVTFTSTQTLTVTVSHSTSNSVSDTATVVISPSKC